MRATVKKKHDMKGGAESEDKGDKWRWSSNGDGGVGMDRMGWDSKTRDRPTDRVSE